MSSTPDTTWSTMPEDAGRTGPASAAPAVAGYTLLRRLAEGGMGSVWEAEQREPIRRRVAIKLIKPGMDSREIIARFESERQVLARMDHPNIARVYDAGTDANGRPYFVMEYVAGVPLTRFADDNRLDLRARLDLFMQVCRAVQHAHSKGVIHRDLKPGNVLAGIVDARPLAKVIDFGIAKALHGERLTDMTYATGVGSAIGTLGYMSPEQASGSPDIDTRADVYALGVVLYELLTGALPFDRQTLHRAAFDEALRVIREQEPPRPSTRVARLITEGHGSAQTLARDRQIRPESLVKTLRSELEWIPLKALRKERDRRYQSPQELLGDIENYLTGRPLHAGPESRVYRARKFVRRNRAAVIGAGALAASFLAGITGTTLALLEARAQRDEAEAAKRGAYTERTDAQRARAQAERRQKQTEAMLGFLSVDLFSRVDPASMRDKPARDAIVSLMLQPAEQTAVTRFADDATTLAELQTSIANVYRSLGRSDRAEPLLRSALRLFHDSFTDREPLLMLAHENLAGTLSELGKTDEAEPLYEQAMRLARETLAPHDKRALQITGSFGLHLCRLGRFEQAAQVLGPATALARDHHPITAPVTLNLITNYGIALEALGRLEEAMPLYKQSYELRRDSLGEDHRDTINSLNNYAYLLESMRKYEDAELHYTKALAAADRILGSDHQLTLSILHNLAGLYYVQERFSEAVPIMADVFHRCETGLGASHPDTVQSGTAYAVLLRKVGRTVESESQFVRVLKGAEALQSEHPYFIEACQQYAELLLQLGRHAEREVLLLRLPVSHSTTSRPATSD
jgi:non-specific serine/threonine protein kinase/serine/threonine-protein kinase